MVYYPKEVENMGKFNQIAMLKEDYMDRELYRTNSRERVIKEILDIEAKLALTKHTRLGLEMLYNDQLRGILTALKQKLINQKIENDLINVETGRTH